MSTAAQRRLLKDLQRIQKEPGDDIMATPHKNNLLKWTATIEGVDGTPWEGGLFQLKLDFTEKYPNKPPHIKFISEMFHPNIYNDGRICLDMLQNQWSPIYDIWSVLTAIRSLLADPNTLSPANMIASDMFTKNKNMYEQRVREIVEKSLENYKDEDQFLEESKREKQAELPALIMPQNARISKKESSLAAGGSREANRAELRLDNLEEIAIKNETEAVVEHRLNAEQNEEGDSDSDDNDESASQSIPNSQLIMNEDSDNFLQLEDEDVDQNEEQEGEAEGAEQQDDQNENNEQGSDEEDQGQHQPNQEYYI